MATTKIKWNEETETQLVTSVGENAGQEISQAQVHTVAEQFGTSARSIGSKLRKMGYSVQLASEAGTSSRWTAEAEAQLVDTITANSGVYTYQELGAMLAVPPKVVQGKILSLELTQHVKAAPSRVYESKFSEEQTQTIVDMASAGASIEAIAQSVGVSEASARGKCLALQRAGVIPMIPVKENKVVQKDVFDGLDVANLTVAQIAESVEKAERSVRGMLTRRKLTCVDYDGAAKAAKRAAE